MSDEANDLRTTGAADGAAKIQEMLAAVRQKARNRLPVPSVTGLLVGGDERELHVATRAGIVGFPTEKVLRTDHPIYSRTDIATFYLSDLEEVRSIFPVQPIHQGDAGEVLDVSAAARFAGSTSTSTAEAGESMTADPIAGVNGDDCEVHYKTDDSLD